MQARLLFIDDDAAICDAASATLIARGYAVTCASDGAGALLALGRDEFDAIISDLNMPGMSGLELCKRAHARFPALPVVLVTAFGTMETAVAAIRAGAYDFIAKPIQMQELLLTLTRALDHRRLEEENRRLRKTIASQQISTEIVGDSPAIQQVHALLRRIVGADTTVLVTGESGTGKELIARALHAGGPNSAGPLVAFNCAAVPETMLESELFGHVRGAFTDASSNRTGLFAQANGGTLFLDEIGEMPLATQVKLLRALQERKVRPVGSGREVPFDARLVSATSRDLESDVAAGRFREDLYYRINVLGVQLPPLRARGKDVLLLAEHFLRALAQRSGKPPLGLAAPAADKLLEYPWPGNIRELRNCMEHALVLTRGESITLQDLPAHVRDHDGNPIVSGLDDTAPLLSMDEVERRYVLQVLHAFHGNKADAARVLGFDRRTLYRKLKLYDAERVALAPGHFVPSSVERTRFGSS